MTGAGCPLSIGRLCVLPEARVGVRPGGSEVRGCSPRRSPVLAPHLGGFRGSPRLGPEQDNRVAGWRWPGPYSRLGDRVSAAANDCWSAQRREKAGGPQPHTCFNGHASATGTGQPGPLAGDPTEGRDRTGARELSARETRTQRGGGPKCSRAPPTPTPHLTRFLR